jgi:hypothetical protein
LFDSLDWDQPLPARTLHGCIIASNGFALTIRPEPGRKRL